MRRTGNSWKGSIALLLAVVAGLPEASAQDLPLDPVEVDEPSSTPPDVGRDAEVESTTDAPAPLGSPPPAESEPAPPALPPEPPVEAPVEEKKGPPLTLTGSFFNRFEYRDGYDRLGVAGGRFPEGDFTVFRARLGLGVGPIDIGKGNAVIVQLSPQVSGSVGTIPSTIAEANLGVHEAYVGLKGRIYRLDVGIFEMDYGESLVIGNLDWHQTARRFQGARTRLASQPNDFYLDIFLTQLQEGLPLQSTPFASGDMYFMGVYSNVGPLLSKKLAWDLYALSELWPTVREQTNPDSTAVAHDTAMEVTLGSRLKVREGVVDYRAEGGIQLGKRLLPTGATPNVFAYHADAEVGMFFAEDKLRVSVHGAYASGDDPTTEINEGWNQLFPTAHKFLGLMDIIGARTNIGSGVLHLMYKPTTDLTFLVDGHLFWRPHTPADVSAYTGAEMNANVIYKIGGGLKFRSMYALFLPDGDSYPSTDPAHYVEIELRYDL